MCEMLLTKVLCFVLIFFSFHLAEAQMISSTLAKARRTQSMRPLSFENRMNVQPIGSSATLDHQQINRNVKQLSSTLADARAASTSIDATSSIMKEEAVHFEEPSRTSEIRNTESFSNIDLEDAMQRTNSEIIDPTRDGFHTRVRNSIQRQILHTAIGSAIGSILATGVIQLSYDLAQSFENDTTTEIPTTAKPSTTTTPDPDGIINNM